MDSKILKMARAVLRFMGEYAFFTVAAAVVLPGVVASLCPGGLATLPHEQFKVADQTPRGTWEALSWVVLTACIVMVAIYVLVDILARSCSWLHSAAVAKLDTWEQSMERKRNDLFQEKVGWMTNGIQARFGSRVVDDDLAWMKQLAADPRHAAELPDIDVLRRRMDSFGGDAAWMALVSGWSYAAGDGDDDATIELRLKRVGKANHDRLRVLLENLEGVARVGSSKAAEAPKRPKAKKGKRGRRK